MSCCYHGYFDIIKIKQKTLKSPNLNALSVFKGAFYVSTYGIFNTFSTSWIPPDLNTALPSYRRFY